MSVKQRLLDYQIRLEDQGVEDVKFCFGALDQKPFSYLCNEVADALEAVLDKKYKEANLLNE